jgi:hypothetical protein
LLKGEIVLASEADIDLSFYVVPFLGCPKPLDKLLESGCARRRELKPGQKVELLPELASVKQTSGDGREILEPNCNVVRRFLKDATALIVSELPPILGLLDRDQRGAR